MSEWVGGWEGGREGGREGGYFVYPKRENCTFLLFKGQFEAKAVAGDMACTRYGASTFLQKMLW